MLRSGGCAGLELRAAGQPPPERGDLLRRRLPAPRSEQELLGEGPQVHRVGLAPRQGVARQCERGTERELGVGPRCGDPGAGGIERPQLLPASRRLQELRRDAAQGVLGPGEVVGPDWNDHGRLVRGRAGGMADDLGVGHHGLVRHGVGHHGLVHAVVCQHLMSDAAVCGGRVRTPHRVERCVIGRCDPQVVVAELLAEGRVTLAGPGLVGFDAGGESDGGVAFEAGVEFVVGVGFDAGVESEVGVGLEAVVGVGAAADGPVAIQQARHEQPQAAAPGEQENYRSDVDDRTGRVCAVVDAGARFGPIRRQRQVGRAEQQERGGRDAHDHDGKERVQLGRFE